MLIVSLRIYLLLISVCFSTFAVAAPKEYGNIYIDEVRTIYDGDTFKATIKGWPPIVGESISIRILGIDTPEIRTKCESEKKLAREAKQFAAVKLREAKKVELRNMRRGKYFRILANVYVDGVSLGNLLIKEKLAVPYDGGKKHDWCPG